MIREYIAFIIGYDCTQELENLNLACDEAYEYALYLADWYLEKFDDPCYESLSQFIKYDIDMYEEYWRMNEQRSIKRLETENSAFRKENLILKAEIKFLKEQLK